ncbi:SPOR domain-containing protein [Solimonas sp. K1W22B-7]|uniref:SPOR domain-containing protein n=1 Tax=Solimonas sp. K1W22B-7 TaxID=2303331 RepID=UPI0013C4EC2B|nr:SPOR domain-containing protein [Solimonas sp. K1W22B-7]
MQAFACAVLLLAGDVRAQAPELARAMLLQPPAWVERGDSRLPLYPGAAILPGDRVVTGLNGRVQLELEDSSTIKLGESAQFELPALEVVDDGSETGLLKGALKILKGAFRYTTGAFSELRKRELDVYAGPTVTAGIRGTDIFAKSDDSQDLLCLLEGTVQVSSPDAPLQTMDQPNTFYVVPRGQPPRPIGPTPPQKLATWLPSTEMRPQEPALKSGGRFRLVLLSVGTEEQAAGEAGRLGALGYPVETLASQTPAGLRHRVLLGGFASYGDALQYRQLAAQRLKIKGAWVMRP